MDGVSFQTIAILCKFILIRGQPALANGMNLRHESCQLKCRIEELKNYLNRVSAKNSIDVPHM